MTKHRNPYITVYEDAQGSAWSAPFTGTSQHVSHVLEWEQPPAESVPPHFRNTTIDRPNRSWESFVGWTLFFVGCACLCSAAFLRIQTHSDSLKIMHKYDKERRLQEALNEDTRKLQLQLARLRDPSRLARIAREELGMQANSLKAVVARLPVRKKKKKLRRLAHSALRR